MTPTLQGYLGNFGPIFTDDTTVPGKHIILVGNLSNGQLQAYQPAFADNLRNSTSGAAYVFPYASADCTLGPYADGQLVGATPAYKVPATGGNFNYYLNVQSDWVNHAAPAYNGGTTTPSGGTTTSGGTTSGGGTTTSGGTVTTTDTTYSAPTITEQITTFLSNYWWLVLIIIIALLWKPVIGPALGFTKKRRRSYR